MAPSDQKAGAHTGLSCSEVAVTIFQTSLCAPSDDNESSATGEEDGKSVCTFGSFKAAEISGDLSEQGYTARTYQANPYTLGEVQMN